MKQAKGFMPYLSGAALAVALLAGHTDARANATTNVVNLGVLSEPYTLDPAVGTSGFDYPIIYSIFDRLIDFDPKTLLPRPGLATSWKFTGADKRTFELKLRQGVKFHDGTPFDAEAVKFNMVRLQEAKVLSDLDGVERIDVVDPYTIVLKLKEQNSSMPILLADRAGMMASPTAIKKLGKDFARNPVGTGPFMYKNWISGQALILDKNPDYWNAKAIRLSGIQYRFIPNATSLASAGRSTSPTRLIRRTSMSSGKIRACASPRSRPRAITRSPGTPALHRSTTSRCARQSACRLIARCWLTPSSDRD